MLHYFGVAPGEYFKKNEADAKTDATKKLVPRALWGFHRGANGTFPTGAYLYMLLGVVLTGTSRWVP